MTERELSAVAFSHNLCHVVYINDNKLAFVKENFSIFSVSI